ncbi:MAG: NADH-quinone oxidoreductase subunit A [Candidatus Methanofastidiosia archaeon]
MTEAGFGFIGVLVVLGFLFGFGGVALPIILNYLVKRKSEEEKYLTYECGENPIGDTKIPLSVQYYTYALIFVIFDVEFIFLFLWASVMRRLGTLALFEMFLFIAILLVGYLYAFKKGALSWLETR